MRFVTPTLLALLAGCATPYQQSGFTGGLSHTQLAPDMFTLHMSGNGYTSGERVRDFAMLRAAELTLRSGYTHFAVLSGRAGTTTRTLPLAVTTTNATATQIGSQTVYSGTSIATGPHQSRSPHATLTIRCFAMTSGTPFPPDVLDATFLRHSIRRKYRMPL